ncbi:dienelactone hydrolase family protein [Streptomyces sp. XM4193]|uniref:dienelactone hydrolase family protein n=1 Tax=Streptomyces sp. XM4193 TaxID=2929782 RepID=UPI001FFB4DE0|nr:dienelactone hydrolase family protein [Streptomyces sp. XM4193]MCK1798729.1 dienelactone hydrolase family protein [Streptomyces sp. XM4193]
MHTTALEILTADGLVDACAAFPEQSDPLPGVLLYPDAFGPRPVLESWARELASHGYFVLLPNVLHRNGRAPVVELPTRITAQARPALFEQLMPMIAEHTPDRVLRDAEAYLQYLTGRPEVRNGPVAAVGYCMGAVLALRTAAAHPERVAAVAGYHSSPLVTDAPDSPHLLAHDVAAEVQLGLAEGDMTPESFAELTAALDAAGVRHSTEIHPGTVHGFTMADTEAYDAAAFDRHRDGLLALLDRTLR